MLVHDYIPPLHPSDHPFLCLVLHGLGDSKEGWKPVATELGLDHLGFVCAQAPIPYYEGWSWFDLDGDMHANSDQIRSSRALLDELVDHLLTTRNLAPERLFVLGFSQGCLMTLDWGLRRRERFAGLIGISGFIALLNEYPKSFGTAAQQQRILMTHGLYDPLIPIASTRRAKDALVNLGIPIDWREYAKAHTLDPEDELADLHAWMAAAMDPTAS